MRKYTKSWISSLFLGLLALSFGVWGIADIFKGSTDTSVATVGSTQIGSDDFQREYQNALKGAPGTPPLTAEEAKKQGIPSQTLQSIISRTALDNEVHDMGLVVSDSVVVSQIRNARIFAGPLGNFDRDTFLRFAQSRGYTEDGFLQVVRDDLARSQLMSSARAGFQLPAGYALALFSYLNEARAADYVILPASAAGDIPPPSDAVLQAYLKAHHDKFSTPEYREVDYAEIGPDDLAAQTKPTDAQLKQQYELNRENPVLGYYAPDRRDVEQITFAKEDEAAAAKAKIDAGVKFDDLAKSLGKTPTVLADVAKDDLGARGAAAFAVGLDGVTAPQKNLSGWVLMHVTKITPGVNKTFDQMKDQIAKDVTTALALSKMGEISNAYTDANSGGLSVIETGKKLGMHTGHIPAVDANGLAPDGSKTPAADDPEFLKAIFTAEVGEDGDPFATKANKLYALKVDGQIPPKLKSLDSVRDQVTTAWTQEQREKLLAAKAEKLAKQATADGNLNAATAAGATAVEQSGRLDRPVSETPQNPNLPPRFVARLFETVPGTAIAGPADRDGAYIIARVTGVAHAPIRPGTLEFLQGTAALSHQAASDFDPALAAVSRNAQGVKINQANADRITGSGEGS